ncbi:MAG: acyl-CoA thioesterase [Elusimicrobia bacterium]|nr:acyl-CoA thioesterase [Elusimicrobiota bacterium]
MDRDFKAVFPIQPRFRDTDAMGHINNAVYLSYLELGRVEYWRKLFGAMNHLDFPFILARVEIDYRSPAKIEDELVIGMRCAEMRGASFDFLCEIWDKKTGRTIASAKTVQVSYDYRKGKPVPLSDHYREKILDFEKSAR